MGSLILELKTLTNKNEIMAQYDFYQDEKCIIWERIRFTIEAPTQEEAITKAASLIRGDVIVSSNQDEQIRIEETEFLFDTAEALPMKYNNGNPTKEIYMIAPHHDRMLANNAHINIE